MKNVLIFIQVLAVAFFARYCTFDGPANENTVAASVSEENQADNKLFKKKLVYNSASSTASTETKRVVTQPVLFDEEVWAFLSDAADGRKLNIEEGKLASERGNSESVRAYGRKMMKEHGEMLARINSLADKKGVLLSARLTEKKLEGLQLLSSKSGDDFDRKFVNMMKVDHRRDMRMFKKASNQDDPQIQEFAEEGLKMIEKHFDEVKRLR